MKNYLADIHKQWDIIYDGQHSDLLQNFLAKLPQSNQLITNGNWYKDAVIYSLYVDLFNETFSGLIAKLDHIKSLGVNCLWVLPVLDSPMQDGGYDVRDYLSVRKDLVSQQNITKQEANQLFSDFIAYAKQQGIHIIFDLVLNHCSYEHEYFIDAKEEP